MGTPAYTRAARIFHESDRHVPCRPMQPMEFPGNREVPAKAANGEGEKKAAAESSGRCRLSRAVVP
jgi:hypothetical protein